MSRIRRVLFIVVVVILAFAFVGFFLDNMERTSLSFIYWETMAMPKSLMLVLACLLGVVAGVLGTMGWVWKIHGKLRKLKKESQLMQKELQAFRRKPLEQRESPAASVAEGKDATVQPEDTP